MESDDWEAEASLPGSRSSRFRASRKAGCDDHGAKRGVKRGRKISWPNRTGDFDEMGGKLSCSQRQRISLARGMVAKPTLLILDEVTSALDSRPERKRRRLARR